MSKPRLTNAQKDEVRKLTQFANRRIKSAFKEYESQGKQIVPNELTGFLRARAEWHTESTPLSRSVVFESEVEYQQTIRALRNFRRSAPTVKEYTSDQTQTTINALHTSLGDMVPTALIERVKGMSVVELSDFWARFSEIARRMGIQYSSDPAMIATLREFFGEDYEHLMS